MKTNQIAVMLGILAIGAVSHAATVKGGPMPPIEPGPLVVTAAQAASSADDSSSMREGVISAISDKRDQVEINGTLFKIVQGKTQVIRNGRSVKPDDLAKGQKVRFTLAGASDRATLGAVYVP